jgi:hypothetical protein
MKRTDYETLAMEEIIVEMEDGFLVGSAVVTNDETAAIKEHQINTEFTDAADFSNSTWD